MLVAPSDHVIDHDAALHAAIAVGLPGALDGKLLTFGIQPTRAHSGYGYIHAAAPDTDEAGVRRVERFVEKPDIDTAAAFLADGNYFWNCGIFLFRPSALVRELRRYAPEVCADVERAMAGATTDGLFVRPEVTAFAAAESISIDYAVMERSSEILVVPVSFGWSDVGSWDAVREMLPGDAQGNVIDGDVVALDVTNSLIRSDADVTVAVVGLDNILCVITQDAAFIAPLSRAQDAKLVVEELRRRSHPRADEPAQVHRPWGSYQTMDRGDRFQTKRLIVKPGCQLSLQKHHHRSEHWIVVNGTAEVTLGSEVKLLQENESLYIPAGTQHRLRNPGKVPLRLIEVQCGPYLGEDDIVRLDDDYGRTAAG